MDKFKKTIQTRLIIMRTYSAVVALLLALSTLLNSNDYETPALSFILGACVGIMLLVLFHIRKYTLALKTEEDTKLLYIEENDERHKFIITSTGGTAMNIVICGLALAAIVSGFFNEMIFFSLIGATIFSALVKGCLKLYYIKNI